MSNTRDSLNYPYGKQMATYANAICETCSDVEWSPVTGTRHWCIPTWTPIPKDDTTTFATATH